MRGEERRIILTYLNGQFYILHYTLDNNGKNMLFYRQKDNIRQYEISLYEIQQKNIQDQSDQEKNNPGRRQQYERQDQRQGLQEAQVIYINTFNLWTNGVFIYWREISFMYEVRIICQED